MATFVLVPGWWLGAWAWQDVARELAASGHDVHPVTLTGMAERAAEATPDVNVDTHIHDILEIVQAGNLRDVVLVAHSGGNMAVTGAADRLSGVVKRVVYVDTGPMPSGMASIDFHPPQKQQQLRAQVAKEGDGWLLPVPPFDPEADPVNLAELTETQLELMRTRGTPQPFGTVTQPLHRPDPIPAIPASMIATTFSPEQVRALATSGNPIFAEMAGLDLHHLPTGHWPMFSRPADLAALLARIAG
ncbi:MAG: alpha/beta fold hydrolase [Micromonosporaceae bacterium]